MKILKKIFFWEEDYTKTENFMLIFYRVFTYLFPAGLLMWNLVIEKLVSNDVSIGAKLGCSGLFLLIVMALIAVIMVGRHFKKSIEKINEKLLDCTDAEKKEELKEKKQTLKKWQSIYRNICLVTPFIIGLILVNLIEKGVVSFRGTLMVIVISLCIGFGFNTIAQNLIAKNK